MADAEELLRLIEHAVVPSDAPLSLARIALPGISNSLEWLENIDWILIRVRLAVDPKALRLVTIFLLSIMSNPDMVVTCKAVQVLHKLTASYDVAIQLQRETTVSRALVTFLKRLEEQDNEDDLYSTAWDAGTTAMANIAGSGTENNGEPMVVTVRPLPPQDDHEVSVVVQALDYVAAGIGYKLWDSGHVFARYVISTEGQALLKDRSVVEIGSGLGLCGLLAARVARDVVLSDYKPSIVANLRASIDRNDASKNTRTVLLDWSLFPTEPLSSSFVELPPDVAALATTADVVIGSDLIFEETALKLPAVVRFLLKPRGIFLSVNAVSHVDLVPNFNSLFQSSLVNTRIDFVPVDWYQGFRRSLAEPEHYIHYGEAP